MAAGPATSACCRCGCWSCGASRKSSSGSSSFRCCWRWDWASPSATSRADVTPIAVVDGPKAQQVVGLLDRSPEHASIHADVVSAPRRAGWLSAGQIRAGGQHGRCGRFIIATIPRVRRACWRAPQVDDAIEDRGWPQEPDQHDQQQPRASPARATSTSSSPDCWA